MDYQIRAILWAQFRTIRNYLPRTTTGTVLLWLLSCLWYGVFAAVGISLAVNLSGVPLMLLPSGLATGLLCMFLFWQIFPLMTLSTGWSLDLSKLVIYPIRERSLFTVEVLLHLTTSPEMIIVLLGAIVGLARHPQLSVYAPLWLLLYIPFNLLLSLGVREWVVRGFKRRRLKELLGIFFLAISVLPSVLLNTALGPRLQPLFLAVTRGRGTPWREIAILSAGGREAAVVSVLAAVAALCVWLALSYRFARYHFSKSLARDTGTFDALSPGQRRTGLGFTLARLFFALLNRLLPDPFAALVEKEFRVLSRSPRFRIVFGIACVFSVVVFLPFSSGRLGNQFMSENGVPAISAYGLLILGEVLLWNAFGFDRKAAQLYFVAPVRFATVLKAKNTVAVIIIFAMTLFVALFSAVLRRESGFDTLFVSVALTLVLTLFFLAFGNLTSVLMARPIDPNQALRKQNSAKTTLWLLLSLVVMIVPVGTLFAARWAFQSRWPFLIVLAVDILAGCITYAVATESAIAHAERDREKMLDELMKGADLISS